MTREVRGRRSGAPRRQQGAPPPRVARGRRAVPHARRHRGARRPDRPRRRPDRAHVARRAPRRGAADARRVRARDAARRAGDLPEGHRADPRARRHVPRRARPRVGRRIGRAHDRAAARDRAHRPRHRLRDPRRLRASAPSRTCTASSATTSRSTSRCATSTKASTNATSIASMLDLPEPWRVVKHALDALRPGGILLAYLPTILQVGRLREELANSPFGMAETARGAATRLARRGTVDPARSPDGCAHGLPHPRALARAGHLSDPSPR